MHSFVNKLLTSKFVHGRPCVWILQFTKHILGNSHVTFSNMHSHLSFSLLCTKNSTKQPQYNVVSSHIFKYFIPPIFENVTSRFETAQPLKTPKQLYHTRYRWQPWYKWSKRFIWTLSELPMRHKHEKPCLKN